MLLTGKLTMQINENFLKQSSVFAKLVLETSESREKIQGITNVGKRWIL